MSLTTTLSRTLQEQLPPCLEPMMNQMVKLMGPHSLFDSAFFSRAYKPYGALFGYTMQTNIKKSMEVLTSTGEKIVEKAAKTSFSNEDYKPGVLGLHYYWEESGLTCESLTVSGAKEAISECYQGPFSGRLLSHVCTDKPTMLDELLLPAFGQSSASWTYANMAGAGLSVIAGVKVIQNLWNGHKSRALMWAAVGAASLLVAKG